MPWWLYKILKQISFKNYYQNVKNPAIQVEIHLIYKIQTQFGIESIAFTIKTY